MTPQLLVSLLLSSPMTQACANAQRIPGRNTQTVWLSRIPLRPGQNVDVQSGDVWRRGVIKRQDGSLILVAPYANAPVSQWQWVHSSMVEALGTGRPTWTGSMGIRVGSSSVESAKFFARQKFSNYGSAGAPMYVDQRIQRR